MGESTELRLTDAMQEAINSAFGTGKPLAIAYVDLQGAPQLSYRGSTQAYGDRALAIWVRNPEGGILPSIARTPAVALIYGDFNPTDRRFMILRGRARVDGSKAVRKKVYDGAHEFERSQDKDQKGVALIIELDSVEGFFGGVRLNMRR
jgi:Pyridoxamine 5'-phosphate oxidase